MADLFTLFIVSAVINNFVLTKFLGLCIFFGVSRRMDISISTGVAITFVMVLSAVLGWILYNFILVPLHIEFLKIVVFVIVITSCVQLVEMVIKKSLPTQHRMWGIYLLLITTNCIVLSIPLINVENNFNLTQSVVNAFGSGVGFALVLILMSSIREKLELAPIPKSLQGFPIAFIVAGLLCLALFGFKPAIEGVF